MARHFLFLDRTIMAPCVANIPLFIKEVYDSMRDWGDFLINFFN